MKFGLFYEHQVPRPRSPEAERRVLLDALEQVALADTLGLSTCGKSSTTFWKSIRIPQRPKSFSLSQPAHDPHPPRPRHQPDAAQI